MGRSQRGGSRTQSALASPKAPVTPASVPGSIIGTPGERATPPPRTVIPGEA
ncbi:hypothetical protein GGQ63_000739 [Prosthecomicrobium pneumaticum]|uniref:Uncharacterized protein n=1 Tax=Prosthecomicrobium pneumaticum TaxID=81895 RepID=A0A7W9CTP2_9HYPH|nr:hypothetical protein [Prosthecomicrobium pneumaticum]